KGLPKPPATMPFAAWPVAIAARATLRSTAASGRISSWPSLGRTTACSTHPSRQRGAAHAGRRGVALRRCRDSPFTKGEFGSFAGVLRPKVRNRYADESDALGWREDGPDQAEGDLVQPVLGFNARFH